MLDRESDIAMYRILTLRSALKLEIAGLKRSRSPSAYMILKKEFGFKGSREKVLEQLNVWIECKDLRQEAFNEKSD